MFVTRRALTVQQQATVKFTQAQFMLIYGCSVVHALASWKPRRIRSGPVDFEQRFTSAFRLFQKPFSYKLCFVCPENLGSDFLLDFAHIKSHDKAHV